MCSGLDNCLCAIVHGAIVAVIGHVVAQAFLVASGSSHGIIRIVVPDIWT